MLRAATPDSFATRSPAAEHLGRHSATLAALACRYNWWLSPEEALDYPERIVALVMNIGSFRDAAGLVETLGEDAMRAVLENAEAGQFNNRTWHYWHYRLGLAQPGGVPPLPVRRIP